MKFCIIYHLGTLVSEEKICLLTNSPIIKDTQFILQMIIQSPESLYSGGGRLILSNISSRESDGESEILIDW